MKINGPWRKEYIVRDRRKGGGIFCFIFKVIHFCQTKSTLKLYILILFNFKLSQEVFYFYIPIY